ncbi:hypothetical protein D9H12_25085 [Escherichia coli]|nr:hypothetical protein [Escherichia coli]
MADNIFPFALLCNLGNKRSKKFLFDSSSLQVEMKLSEICDDNKNFLSAGLRQKDLKSAS